ncbi:hypothetical protein T02_14362 [Trichinella nativa]|uniref:Uncharacterized protein n=1 Tax=Trichinella nativa TaxID=6335 RepID=A0A0V1LET9_9BILA|nr:hypothetical protein T02_14362 [Trichinella nativa]
MMHFLSIHLRAEPAPPKSRTFHQADKLLTPVPQSQSGNSSITELLCAGATGNDWSGQLKKVALAGVLGRSRTEAEKLCTGFCRNQSQLYVPAIKNTVPYKQAESRLRISKVHSTEISEDPVACKKLCISTLVSIGEASIVHIILSTRMKKDRCLYQVILEQVE